MPSRHTSSNLPLPKLILKDTTANISSGPSSEQSIDTPESLRECFDLRVLLDTRIDLWNQAAQSTHPARMYGGLARHIVLQATLQDDDLYMRQWTERTYGPHPAGPPATDPEQDKQARDRAKLLGVTTDAKLDDMIVENDTYRQAFENYQDFFESIPGATDQQQALTALRRMFIKREQINRQLGLRTFETDSYALVIMGLATEV